MNAREAGELLGKGILVIVGLVLVGIGVDDLFGRSYTYLVIGALLIISKWRK